VAERLERRCLLSAAATSSHLVWSSAADPAGDVASVEPGWIVRLNQADVSGISHLDQVSELLSSASVPVAAVRGLGTPGLILARSGESVASVEQSLALSRFVQSFERDAQVGAQLTPNDEFYADQLGLRNLGANGAVSDADIDADAAFDITTGSSDIVVAVIDSGIDYTHPDLFLNVWLNPGEIPTALRSQLVDGDGDGAITFRDLNLPANSTFVTDLEFDGNDFIDAGDLLADATWENGVDEDDNGRTDDLIGWDFRDNDNDPLDTHGHGTHVSGTIGAVGNNGIGIAGLNWNTSIIPLRFLDRQPGLGLTGSRTDAIAAINYSTNLVEDQGIPIRVSSNSWGSLDDFSPELRSAIEANGDAGVVFVAAAGNGEGRTGRGIDLDTENLGFFPATYDLDHIIAVAASDPRDNLAIFSQFGATSIDLAAPGVNILSTDINDGFAFRNGTSMATPHVAGTAALIIAQQSDATPQEVRQAILQSVDTRSAFSGRVATGGRLNTDRALQTDTFAPKASLLSAPDVTTDAQLFFEFDVLYRDNADIDFFSIDNSDLIVTPVGNPGAPLTATVSNLVLDSDPDTAGSQPIVTYRIIPPGGRWNQEDNGDYQIDLQPDAVADTRTGATNRTPEETLGTFNVNIQFVGQIEIDIFADGADPNPTDGVSDNGSGQSTLRSAIQTANALPGLNTLVLEAGTYELTITGAGEDASATGDLDITDDLLILGNGATIKIIGGHDRVFDLASDSTLTIEGLTITGGDGLSDSGGGIRTSGTLVVSKTLLHANSATTGGAIASINGNVTLTNSTISTNAATFGAGLDILRGSLIATHVTITANTASDTAGGIRQAAPSSVTLTSTILANNSANADSDTSGTFSSRFSLIGDAGSATGLTDGDNGNQVGDSANRIDPSLGPLADNAGLTLTHRVLDGSPAIRASAHSR
jgi:subtilisin family serine protease